jgi:hypothetical protein
MPFETFTFCFFAGFLALLTGRLWHEERAGRGFDV